MKAYNIPLDGRTYAEYVDYVTSLPITFKDDRNILIAGDGYVEVNGVIEGFEEVTLRKVG